MKINFTDAWGNEQSIDLAERELWIIGSHSCGHLVLRRDDQRRLSRIQCHIRNEKENWFIFDGCPAEPLTWAEKLKNPQAMAPAKAHS